MTLLRSLRSALIWDKEFLAPSMVRSTAEAFNEVCCLDRNRKLDDSPQDKKQKAATTLLRGELHRQDFAGPISLRASKVLGPISCFRVVQTLLHMKLVSRASRPLGLPLLSCASFTTGYVRHKDFTLKERNKRVELDVRMSSHYNECPRLYNMFTSFCGQSTVLPRRNHLLHDLITPGVHEKPPIWDRCDGLH